MSQENAEKTVISLKNGAKFILEKEPFKAILSSPEAKNRHFREKLEEKPT